MGRRTLLLIAAFLVAALGTTMVFLYVNGLEDKYIQGDQPRQVLVASGTIPAGTKGSTAEHDALFTTQKMASRDVAPGALSSAAAIADQVALAPIFEGEQILASKFGTRSAATLAVPRDKVAVSVQLTPAAQVAGYVSEGSMVAVFFSPRSQEGSTGRTDVLLPKVPVIAVGGPGSGGASSSPASQQTADQSSSVTLGLTPQEAKKIISAQANGGTIYLALLGDDSPTLEPGQAVSSQNLFR